MSKAVLFDLDGTLLDTAADFEHALNAMRKRRELPELPLEAVRQYVSAGARALVSFAFDTSPDQPGFDILLEELLSEYLCEIGNHTDIYPGLEALIADFTASEQPWGIVTNKPRLFTEALLAELPLPTPPVLICPDDVGSSKPNPDGLLMAAELLGIYPDNCLYIGDHARDIEAGRNAGMLTLAAAYGYLSEEESADDWEADLLAFSSGELIEQVYAWLNDELEIGW